MYVVEMLHSFSKFYHSTWPHKKKTYLHFCITFTRALFYFFGSQYSMEEFTTTSASVTHSYAILVVREYSTKGKFLGC